MKFVYLFVYLFVQFSIGCAKAIVVLHNQSKNILKRKIFITKSY